MLTYTPNSFQPLSKTPPPSPERTPNYRYLYRSSFHPRTVGRTDLTQSVCVHPISEGGTPLLEDRANRPTFLETVQVVPESSGGYRVLRPESSGSYRVPQPGASIYSLQRQPSSPVTKDAGKRRFCYNIGSSDMQKRMQGKLSMAHLRRDATQSHAHNAQQSFMQSCTPAMKNGDNALGSVQVPRRAFLQSLAYPSSRDKEQDLHCSCKLYHSHTFKGRPVNRDVVQETRAFIDTLTSVSKKEESREDNHDDLRNIFWTPSLSFHPYYHGDKTVRFSSSSFLTWFGLVSLSRKHSLV